MFPFLAVVSAALLAGAGPPHRARALDNGLARTPPMGWNSWNHFGCDVSASMIKETADAMAANGMRAAGYRYLVIDDCWQVARDGAGKLVADSARFPGGMKPLADYVHSKGLEFGLYTDAGRQTCQGRPGTYRHEDQDARTFADWGVDFVKEDWCHADSLDAPARYAAFRDALARTGRPIVFSICEWGLHAPWEWAPGTGNLWRTTGDIDDSWNSMLANLDISGQHAAVAGPGHWNDPDMLEVGNGGMTDEEYRAHFSLWAITAAPLIAGNDVRAMSPATRAILLNAEVIAVDQDSLGAQGTLVAERSPELQVWMKPLAGGARAVVLLNRSELQTVISAPFWRLRLPSGPASVRDLWAHADLGTFRDRFSATVPAHGVVMIRVAPAGAQARPTPVAPAADSTSQTLLRLEDSWPAALVHRDAAVFERLLADGFIYSEDDRTIGRAAVMADLVHGSDTVTAAHNEGMEVHSFGATAIVTGWLVMQGHGGGARFDRRYRFTDVWMRRDGRWQIVAAHDYLVPSRAR